MHRSELLSESDIGNIVGNKLPLTYLLSERKSVYCSDLSKLKIFHHLTQENPGSENT
uniref:Uncharacterized protein n=1 Tax=Catagonus wagneri TaxID=51154 RepID=A0A8C3YMX5_9CETA